jgi:hypothetical protein
MQGPSTSNTVLLRQTFPKDTSIAYETNTRAYSSISTAHPRAKQRHCRGQRFASSSKRCATANGRSSSLSFAVPLVAPGPPGYFGSETGLVECEMTLVRRCVYFLTATPFALRAAGFATQTLHNTAHIPASTLFTSKSTTRRHYTRIYSISLHLFP